MGRKLAFGNLVAGVGTQYAVPPSVFVDAWTDFLTETVLATGTLNFILGLTADAVFLHPTNNRKERLVSTESKSLDVAGLIHLLVGVATSPNQ